MQEPVDKFFDENYFDNYWFDFNVRYPFLNVIAATLVEKYSPKSVIDLGCGKGHLVYAFNELGVECFGVDNSDYALSQSPDNVKKRLFKADLASATIPFGDNRFDMVTVLGLLEYLEDLDHIIHEIKRILMPHGILFIRTPKRSIEILFRILGLNDSTHVNVHNRAFWVETLKVHSFEYIGEFPRTKHREARLASYSQKQAIKKVLNAGLPDTNSGRMLLNLGKTGKWLRGELASCTLLLPLEAMLFKLQ